MATAQKATGDHILVRASARIDFATARAIKKAAQADQAELPTRQAVLDYCLKLGIESYLENQPACECCGEPAGEGGALCPACVEASR